MTEKYTNEETVMHFSVATIDVLFRRQEGRSRTEEGPAS